MGKSSANLKNARKVSSKLKAKTKTASKSSKKAPAVKKPKLSKAAKKEASVARLKMVKTSGAQAKAITAAKKQASGLPVISTANPYKQFMDFWNYKNETFMAGMKRFFTEFVVPGSTEKQRGENSNLIIEKIEEAMRKEPLPQAIIEILQERFDAQKIRMLSTILQMKPRTTIRVNTLKADVAGFAGAKVAEELKAKRSQISPWALDIGGKMNPSEHPSYERGLFELEDEGSQLATLLVNARPHQRVLDMCARDGDHTLGLSATMRNKGSLFVYDVDPNKLKTLKQRAQRAGVDNIRIVTDAQIAEVKSLDAILIDAPNSGTGMLARHPDIKWRFRKEDLPKLIKVQAALLREGARKLKLGGRLVYCTTSLNPQENEGQLEHFLKASHNSYRLIPASEYLKHYVLDYCKNFFGHEMSEATIKNLTQADPFFTIMPDESGCNGLFAAVVERTRISN